VLRLPYLALAGVALAENLIRAGQVLFTMTAAPSAYGWRSHGRMTGRAAATDLLGLTNTFALLRLLPMTARDGALWNKVLSLIASTRST
jgi:hypothetical protein